ncbi:uncharacterized protein LOC130670055 [Microplitis mediator]|uniref:uncharacterized protein LOC130670055 n=1 Tax=Microplitis mediator TaxID=375433 RepID=UPI002552F5CC|nr:uncharacterized protein LOC130670055 [Microplitis mediator]
MKIKKKQNKITTNAETLVQPSDKEVSQPAKKIKMKKQTDDSSGLSSIKKNKNKKKKKNKNSSKIQKDKIDPQTNGVSLIESVDLDVSEDVMPKEKKRSAESLENSVDKIEKTAKKIKLDNKIDKSNEVPSSSQNKKIAKSETEPKNISFSVEELEEKIKAISSRENISKTAKRNLAALKKKLKVKQEFLASSPSVTSTVSVTEKLNTEKNPQETCDDKEKDLEESETQNLEVEKKLMADKRKEKNRVNKKSKNLNNDGKNTKEESDFDDDNDGSSNKKQKKLDNFNTSSDSKDFDEEETEDTNEKQKVSKKKKNETRTSNFVKKEMDEIKKLGHEKDGTEGNELNSSIQKKENAKETKKKTRYVLFVGNIPYSTCVDDVKNHFLTKVSKVISVRIPTAKQTHSPRGIAYVEFSDSTDYEKGLSLHHSILNGRRINVQYTQSGSKNAGKKSEIVSKNKKLHALRRQGKLAGSVKHSQKRNKKNFKKSQTT